MAKARAAGASPVAGKIVDSAQDIHVKIAAGKHFAEHDLDDDVMDTCLPATLDHPKRFLP